MKNYDAEVQEGASGDRGTIYIYRVLKLAFELRPS